MATKTQIDTQVTPQSILGELVADVPSRAEVFDHLRMSYSIGGRRTVEQAADEYGIAAEEIIRAIEAHDRDGQHQVMDWSLVPPSRLVDQLDREHMTFLTELYLPAQGVLERVALREGGRFPELVELCDRFTAMERQFVNHFDDEEHGIFRACRAVEGDDLAVPDVDELGLVEIAAQHVDIVAELDALYAIIDAVAIEADELEDWRQFRLAFTAIECAMRRHMHCEEYILPRSVINAH